MSDRRRGRGRRVTPQYERGTQPELWPTETVAPEQGRAERDAVLRRFEITRAEVLAQLRAAAWALWHRTGQPVSVNDIRPVLTALSYTGDPRLLGAVFNRSEWQVVGETQTNSPVAHARPIRRFCPRGAERST